MNVRVFRCELGAIGAEVVAVFVLVAALVAALWSAGIERRVGAEAERALCQLFAPEAECEVAAEDDDEASGDGTDDGTTGDSDAGDGDGPDAGTPLDPPVDIPPTEVILGEDAVVSCGVATVAWDATVAGGGVTVTVDGVGVTISGGATTSGSLTTTPDHLDAIRDGSAPMPDPFDPTTLPPGAAMTFGREHFTELGLEAAYRAIGIELGFGSGEEWSIGVVRNPDGTVQLLIGEASIVSSSIGVGVSAGPVSAAVAIANSTTDSQVQVVHIDVTAPGGLDTYLAALTAQAVPDRHAAGVVGTGSIAQNAYEQLIELGVTITPAMRSEIDGHEESLGLVIGSGAVGDVNRSSSITWIVDDDGTMTSVAVAYEAGSTLTITSPVPGSEYDRSYSLVLEDVDAGTLVAYGELTGRPIAVADDTTIRVDLTAEQLRSIQEMSRAVQDSIPGGSSALWSALADAQNANEILVALHRHAGVGLLDRLMLLAADYAALTGEDLLDVLADLGVVPTFADGEGCFSD